MSVARPRTLVELAECVTSSTIWMVKGTGTKLGFLGISQGGSEVLDLGSLTGIEELVPDDRYVTVLAGTPVVEVEAALNEKGQSLGLAPDSLGPWVSARFGTVGGLLSMALPHGTSGQLGGVRGMCLGLWVVRAGGELARNGGRTVKNVAGYDAMRLFIGARGTLGVIAKATLRTYPLASVPFSEAVSTSWEEPSFIQRVRRSDWCAAMQASDLLAFDPASRTLWHSREPMRFAEDWVLPRGRWPIRGRKRLELMARARQVFDPNGVFNPQVNWELEES